MKPDDLKELLDTVSEKVRKETIKEVLSKIRDRKKGFYIEFSLMEEYEFNGIINDVEKELGVE